MNTLVALTALAFLGACGTTQNHLRLSEKVQAEEVRSLEEIRSHADTLIAAHPELDAETRSQLKAALQVAMDRHQEFKDQESKLLQLLLEKSLQVQQRTPQEQEDKAALEKQLDAVYDQKAQNIRRLITQIVDLSSRRTISDGARDDLMIIMRDFR